MRASISISPARQLTPGGDVQAILIQPSFRLLLVAPLFTLPELMRRHAIGRCAELPLDRDPGADRIVYDPTAWEDAWPDFYVGGLLAISGNAVVVGRDPSTGALRAPARSVEDISMLVDFCAFQPVLA